MQSEIDIHLDIEEDKEKFRMLIQNSSINSLSTDEKLKVLIYAYNLCLRPNGDSKTKIEYELNITEKTDQFFGSIIENLYYTNLLGQVIGINCNPASFDLIQEENYNYNLFIWSNNWDLCIDFHQAYDKNKCEINDYLMHNYCSTTDAESAINFITRNILSICQD